MSEFEIVERPIGRSRKQSAEMDALMETATSGKAIRVPLNGIGQSQVTSHWYQSLRLRGYALRSRKDGDTLALWTVKK